MLKTYNLCIPCYLEVRPARLIRKKSDRKIQGSCERCKRDCGVIVCVSEGGRNAGEDQGGQNVFP